MSIGHDLMRLDMNSSMQVASKCGAEMSQAVMRQVIEMLPQKL